MSKFLVRLARLAVAGAAALSVAGCLAMVNTFVPGDGYRVEADLAYGSDPRQKLDLYVPEGLDGAAPVILFFYGGSWQNGEKSDYRAFGQTFAGKGFIVAVADYRVYPQVRFPGFVEDGALAVKYLRAQVKLRGGDPSRLYVAGHSAGAYIAVMLASDPAYLRKAGGDFGWLRGAIGIAGPYDILPLTDKTLIDIFGGVNRAETQPITHIDGVRPPMLLVTGDDDDTVSPLNAERMAKRLRAAGSPVTVNIYPGVGHAGIILSLMPGFRSKTTLEHDIVQFVQTGGNGE
ncbi:MAG: alpha/beta hydrolase [Alphaproteobacteria bacterium]|nr:alpha/beta hydrolase [Alphaproteobacteria bacterium]